MLSRPWACTSTSDGASCTRKSSTGSDPEFEAIAPQMISVTEQSNGLVYRAPVLNNNNTRVPNFAYRAAMAYVTGSHSFKTGFNRRTASRRRPTTT